MNILRIQIILGLSFLSTSCLVSQVKYQDALNQSQSTQKKLDSCLELADKQVVDMQAQVNTLKGDHESAEERLQLCQNLKDERSEQASEIQKTYEHRIAELKTQIKSAQKESENFRLKYQEKIVGTVIFRSGTTELGTGGKKVLDRIGERLKEFPGRNIQVRGHTDNTPPAGTLKEKYPSNWELASARSLTVLRYFVNTVGVDRKRISAASYSHYHPKVKNNSSANRRANRRIEVFLMP